jgi:8-oxo-dGTP diphosphatase
MVDADYSELSGVTKSQLFKLMLIRDLRDCRAPYHACRDRRPAPILDGVSGSLIPCVGAVIKDGQGRLLLIKRGHEPGAGLWSLPGGRIEPGETDAKALVREMLEETGLAVEPGRLLGRVQRPGLGGSVIDIRDYAATVIGGTLRPGDDAADARWADAAELAALAVTEGLLEALTEWGVLGLERQLSSLFSICTLGALFVPPSDPPRFFNRC